MVTSDHVHPVRRFVTACKVYHTVMNEGLNHHVHQLLSSNIWNFVKYEDCRKTTVWGPEPARTLTLWGPASLKGTCCSLEEQEGYITWFPPLFGFTNTSRGFMSWEGRGFTRKGFQRPSWSWETKQSRKFQQINMFVWSLASKNMNVITTNWPQCNTNSKYTTVSNSEKLQQSLTQSTKLPAVLFCFKWGDESICCVSLPHLCSLLVWLVAF